MIQTASYSDIGGRPQNEDTVKEIRKGEAVCMVVADGLGGHGGGVQASSLAAQTVCDGWQGGTDTEEIARLVQEAHEHVQGIQTESCAMKTTIVVLVIRDSHAVWAHAGDTRLYHFFNGNWVFQTKDHSASQIAVTLGDITSDQIRFHEDRNRVLRALGQEGSLKVDTKEELLLSGQHAFLLCTDGFWEYVLENEMEECLRSAKNPQDWLNRMREILYERVPEDNDNNSAAALWLEQ
ncbi:MAG: serine/threonine-protein phosphatase [Acetatifactor sp.]|nr:serine/threonine-protein phosphatase [Acetatifactor sp.]